MGATMNVKPRRIQTVCDVGGWPFTIVGTPLPILKSILAKTVIYPIGVPAGRAGRISAAIRQPLCPRHARKRC
ncbi:hypothetical protein SAMN05414139_01571 [Burkholderia sp. D7]|nr:hypothetical protein SAMN05414139_01571 [Burkholderia sp. D7]